MRLSRQALPTGQSTTNKMLNTLLTAKRVEREGNELLWSLEITMADLVLQGLLRKKSLFGIWATMFSTMYQRKSHF